MNSRSRPWSFALQVTYLLAVFVFIAAPMAVIVVFSFDANRFPTIPWGGFSLHWHREALADRMIRDAAFNSLLVAIGTATFATALGFAAAYLDYRYEFFGKKALILLVAVPPAVPVTILGMAMLAFLSRIGLFGQLLGVIVAHVAIASSFAMALIRLRLEDFAREMEPAAWNLGASRLRGLLHVVIPFCRSSLVAALLLSAAVSFDEFMVAWFVGGLHETIPVRILNMLQGPVNPKINAVGAMVLMVSVTLMILAQRFLAKSAAPAKAAE